MGHGLGLVKMINWCELMKRDYLPSISFEKFPVVGGRVYLLLGGCTCSAPFLSCLSLSSDFRRFIVGSFKKFYRFDTDQT